MVEGVGFECRSPDRDLGFESLPACNTRMYSLLVALPLVGSLVSAGGFWFGVGGGYVATGMLMSSFVLSVMAFCEVGLGGTIITYTYAPWMVSGLLDIQWGFRFDSLTVTMLVVVPHLNTQRVWCDQPFVP